MQYEMDVWIWKAASITSRSIIVMRRLQLLLWPLISLILQFPPMESSWWVISLRALSFVPLPLRPHTDQCAGVQGLALQNCPRAQGGPKETAE
jgi:hypothetical protein